MTPRAIATKNRSEPSDSESYRHKEQERAQIIHMNPLGFLPGKADRTQDDTRDPYGDVDQEYPMPCRVLENESTHHWAQSETGRQGDGQYPYGAAQVLYRKHLHTYHRRHRREGCRPQTLQQPGDDQHLQ